MTLLSLFGIIVGAVGGCGPLTSRVPIKVRLTCILTKTKNIARRERYTSYLTNATTTTTKEEREEIEDMSSQRPDRTTRAGMFWNGESGAKRGLIIFLMVRIFVAHSLAFGSLRHCLNACIQHDSPSAERILDHFDEVLVSDAPKSGSADDNAAESGEDDQIEAVHSLPVPLIGWYSYFTSFAYMDMTTATSHRKPPFCFNIRIY